MLTHLYELLRQRAAAYPTATALGGQQGLRWHTLDSRQLLELVDELAGELAALGVRDGDRVVTWLPNHWRTPVYLFALWKLGAIVVPFDREMNADAARRILASVEPRLVLVGYDELPTWALEGTVVDWWEPGAGPPRDACSNPRPAPNSGGVAAPPQSPPILGGRRRPGPGGEDEPSPGDPPRVGGAGGADFAAIVFTSGTTGNPKGCMITHANLCSQVEAVRDNIPLDPSCRLASILPLSHLFELTGGLLYPLSAGAAIHYVPSRRAPDVLRVLTEQRITHMIAVPQLLTLMGQALDEQLRALLPGPLYRALNGLAERLPLDARRRLFWPVHRKLGGHLRMMASGGAALPIETQRLWERLGVRIVQGYGTSECSPVVACGLPDGSTPPGSVGRPLRGVEVRLSQEGELLVKGPNVMRGYWQDPERTAAVLRDGWYATGDLASLDAAGNITLAGRAQDLIVLPSGMNVWPQDVEDVLRQQPAVKDAAVIAVPTTAGGAILHAYLLPVDSRDHSGELTALVARANGQLAQHQRVATVSWWPDADFPRTSTLKVRRSLLPLPESVDAVKIESVMAADDPVGQAISAAARVTALGDDQTLGELGLDSMGLVALGLALEEKTGKAVGDADLRLEMTVGGVRAFLADAPALADGAPRGAGGPRSEKGKAVGPVPLWPYTWGRALRVLAFPWDLLYRLTVTRTVVLGAEHLARLPTRVVFAGTHHSFADMPLVRRALAHTPARRLASRLIVATAGEHLLGQGLVGLYGTAAFGLYPLRQHAGQEESLRGLATLAGEGVPVLIFPQGIHVDPEAERAGQPSARFKPGVAHLAAALEATVVPFGLAGTELVIPPEAPPGFKGYAIAGIPVSLRRGPLAIAFGAPLTLQPGESPQAFAARLQDACFALTRQAEDALQPRSSAMWQCNRVG